MNAYKYIGSGIIFIGIMYLLIPHSAPQLIFQQFSPGLIDSQTVPQPENIIRVTSKSSIQQRLWIPAILITDLHFFVWIPPNTPLPTSFQVNIVNEVTKTIIAQSAGKVREENGHQVVMFHFNKPLPASEEWVEVQFVTELLKPIYFYREINNDAYRGGQLMLIPQNKNLQGVLAFTMYSTMYNWPNPKYGLFIFVIAVIGWEVVSKKRFNKSFVGSFQ